MRTVRRRSPITVVVIATFLVAVPSPAGARTDGHAWREVYRSPYDVAGFTGIDARNREDVWITGHRTGADGQPASFTVRFDGRAWGVVPADAPADHWRLLNDVVAVGPMRAWAVGQQDGWGVSLRWDGTAWRRVPVPAIVTSLEAIDRVPGTRSLVAAGHGRGPIVVRWEGTRWSSDVVRSDLPSGQIWGVEAVSDRLAWAVGDNGARPLILRGTRTGWRRVPLPVVGAAFLADVAAIGSERAFAIGSEALLRWNGERWRAVPRFWARNVRFAAVDAGRRSIWVTGIRLGAGTTSESRPFAMRWRRGWRIVPVQDLGHAFTAVSVHGGTVWATGPLGEPEANSAVFLRDRPG